MPYLRVSGIYHRICWAFLLLIACLPGFLLSLRFSFDPTYLIITGVLCILFAFVSYPIQKSILYIRSLSPSPSSSEYLFYYRSFLYVACAYLFLASILFLIDNGFDFSALFNRSRELRLEAITGSRTFSQNFVFNYWSNLIPFSIGAGISSLKKNSFPLAISVLASIIFDTFASSRSTLVSFLLGYIWISLFAVAVLQLGNAPPRLRLTFSPKKIISFVIYSAMIIPLIYFALVVGQDKVTSTMSILDVFELRVLSYFLAPVLLTQHLCRFLPLSFSDTTDYIFSYFSNFWGQGPSLPSYVYDFYLLPNGLPMNVVIPSQAAFCTPSTSLEFLLLFMITLFLSYILFTQLPTRARHLFCVFISASLGPIPLMLLNPFLYIRQMYVYFFFAFFLSILLGSRTLARTSHL